MADTVLVRAVSEQDWMAQTLRGDEQAYVDTVKRATISTVQLVQ